MNPECFAASLTAVAIAMSKGRSAKEVGLMSTTLGLLSSALSTIAFTKELSDGDDEDILFDIIQ